MNQIILNMENSITPKAIPVIVPLAYQAILNLQERISKCSVDKSGERNFEKG